MRGLRPRLNVIYGSLQPLGGALSRQSAGPKSTVVFFPSDYQNAERIASLHRQTKSLLRPKGWSKGLA